MPTPQPNPTRPAIYSPDAAPGSGAPAARPSNDGAPANQLLPVVIGARIGEHEDRTRFVIEMSDPVKLRVFTLANPNRVVIDCPKCCGDCRAADKPSGAGVVRSYRYGLFRPGDSRFVIDLNRAGPGGRPGDPAARGRLRLSRGARSLPHRAGQVRTDSRMAGRSQGQRGGGREVGVAYARSANNGVDRRLQRHHRASGAAERAQPSQPPRCRRKSSSSIPDMAASIPARWVSTA